jgi:hypothetical protein
MLKQAHALQGLDGRFSQTPFGDETRRLSRLGLDVVSWTKIAMLCLLGKQLQHYRAVSPPDQASSAANGHGLVV